MSHPEAYRDYGTGDVSRYPKDLYTGDTGNEAPRFDAQTTSQAIVVG